MYTNCDVSSGDNTGCQIKAKDSNTYGDGFNANGGGVYATEWTGSFINIHFFPRGSIPPDVESGSPNPSSWGPPVARFSQGCDIKSSFTNQQIVFDTTFCGDWAGADEVWGASCAQTTGTTCQGYVGNNPQAFQEAYWKINGLRVYQQNGGSASPSSAAPSNAPSSYAPPISQSTFQSSVIPSVAPSAPPSGAPSAAPSYGPPGSASGWAPSAPVTQAPAPSSPAENSGAPWSAQPTNSWGGGPGGSPWQQSWGAHNNHRGAYVVGAPQNAPEPTGSVGEHANGRGAWSVGTPIEGAARRARHLRHHKMRHGGGRL